MLWILVVIIAVGLIWLISAYNGLIRLRQRVKNGWSQIDVQLKRRYDLIPNLVETCKGYMQHEREVLENVTRARPRLSRLAEERPSRPKPRTSSPRPYVPSSLLLRTIRS